MLTNADGLAKAGGFDGVRLATWPPPAGWVDFNAAMNRAAAEFAGEPTRADDPGIIYFTSATTGEPKMVLHTQASYGLGPSRHGGVVAGLPAGRRALEYLRPGLGQGRLVQLLRSLAHGRLRFCGGYPRQVRTRPTPSTCWRDFPSPLGARRPPPCG